MYVFLVFYMKESVSNTGKIYLAGGSDTSKLAFSIKS